MPKQLPLGRRQLSTERTFLHSGLCRIQGPLTHQMLLLSRCATYYQAGQMTGNRTYSLRTTTEETMGFMSVQLLSCVRLLRPHRLPEFTQTHVHRVGDAIQPSHPLSSPSPAFNLSQHQGLFQWALCEEIFTQI